MPKPKFNPFKNLVLDPYEKEFEHNLDEKKIKMTPPSASRLAALQKAASDTLKKNKNINLRVSESTLLGLKSKAKHLGIPYQTLATSILHQYANQ